MVATRNEEWGDKLKSIQVSFGAVLGPQDSWLLMRGIKSLAARMEIQQRNAEVIASWLSEQPEVKKVYYPGLPSHPGRDLHFRQASGPGAVISFELANAEGTRSFLRSVTLPLLAPSLGGVESILSYPSAMSHAFVPPEERLARGVTDSLVRLSVGLEDPEDMIADFHQALRKG
ncbi:MAG: Cystathionine beta-lyase MetC [Syntrophorhabdaceae bacterium PtaU1.Bin034]|nr:MAG: Cystathionine beta-lyase MetC [Syntrophorhabdaceae bacterium PtaU1.Bin034]